ncbi:MAG: DNA/RNA helicase, partial [Lactobacillus sp.]|nr:DNA/RNA helicase [Lactobacillus sp.]
EPGLEQLTICTTHQLLKFFRAFDLLIIDEADSFPYVQNPELNFAAKNALKNNGQMVYLTATPTKDLLKLVKKGQIQQLKLNRRFHGYSLPVPKEKLFLRPFLEGKRINPKLVQEISKVIKAKHPLLLFLPRIDLIKPYVSALRNEPEFKQITIEGVHANDVQRIAKVDNFR